MTAFYRGIVIGGIALGGVQRTCPSRSHRFVILDLFILEII